MIPICTVRLAGRFAERRGNHRERCAADMVTAAHYIPKSDREALLRAILSVASEPGHTTAMAFALKYFWEAE